MTESVRSPYEHHAEASGDERSGSLDLAVFIPSMCVVVVGGVLLLSDPVRADAMTRAAMDFVTGDFGWLFELVVFGALIFVLWLAFGRFGSVKLGAPDDDPEFDTPSWVAMMFSAGIGIGLVSWAFAEPLYYMLTPPFGIEAGSDRAAEWAHMYAQFHWGLLPWGLYALCAVPVAYSLYVTGQPYLRMSVAARPALGDHSDRWPGAVVDTLVIIGMIGGAGTSIGLGVPLVSRLAADVFAVDDTLLLRMGVLAAWTGIFSTSLYFGLSKGIRVLADINIVLAVILAIFVLVVGPTVFILKISANSFGLMIDNFFRMSFWLDPVQQRGFPEAWTLFYWAWWIAYAPLMGLFFGRISRGRTIRQTTLGILLWGSAGCWAFMAICGGWALDLELSGALAATDILTEDGIPAMVSAVVHALPGGNWLVLLFMVLGVIFLATTLDSVAYVLASVSTRRLKGAAEPARWLRLAWAFGLAFISAGLLAVDALAAVQASTIVTALPLVPVILLLCWSLYRALHRDFGHAVRPPVVALDPQDPDRVHQL